MAFLLVELCGHSENQHSLKSLVIVHKTLEAGPKSSPIFYKLHSNNIVGVPNNLLYLQKVFERYTQTLVIKI